MKSIILSLFLLLSPSVSLAYHTLPHEVNWVTYYKTSNIKMKSTLSLSRNKMKRVKIMYNDIKSYFKLFENLDCNLDNFNDVEIKIISKKMLRDKSYFYKARFDNFGRYFPGEYTIYVTHDIFVHQEYLAHELAHYFYDKCGVQFLNNEKEHDKVYKFQNLYKQRCLK